MQYYQQVPLGMGIRGGKMYLEEKKDIFQIITFKLTDLITPPMTES